MNIAGGNGDPNRFGAPAGTFAYGCPSVPDVPWVPSPDVAKPMPSIPNVVPPFDWSKMHPEMAVLTPCVKCNRHHRVGEPCPFCMRDELNALKLALGDKAKPAEEIERLRSFMRKMLGALRDIHQVTGSTRLAELITEGDLLLGIESNVTP